MAKKHNHLLMLAIGLIVLAVIFFLFKDYILPALAVVGGGFGYLWKKKTPKDPVPAEVRKIEENAYREIDAVKKEAHKTDQDQRNIDQRTEKLEEQIEKRRGLTYSESKREEAAAPAPEESKTSDVISQVRQDAVVTDGKSESLNEKAGSLEERINKRRSGGLGTAVVLVALLLLVTGPVWAEAAGLYIPKNYDELKSLYFEADQQIQEALDIIHEQKQQITELQRQRDQALQAAEDLKKVNQEKDKILKSQAAELEQLNRRWGVTGGIQLPGAPNAAGGLNLGISRKTGRFSWGLGGTWWNGLQLQSINGNCTVWF